MRSQLLAQLSGQALSSAAEVGTSSTPIFSTLWRPHLPSCSTLQLTPQRGPYQPLMSFVWSARGFLLENVGRCRMETDAASCKLQME